MTKEIKELKKKIKDLRLIEQSHKDLNGKLRTQLTFIKEYCEDEMKERTNTTDETEDICKGRREFAEGLLEQIKEKETNNKEEERIRQDNKKELNKNLIKNVLLWERITKL